MKLRKFFCISLAIISVAMLAACGKTGESIDPSAWGYDCEVTYDALGGKINEREVRHTYYASNSYLFEPSGSDGLLIQPVKDGYVLAGWYTSKTDVLDEEGNVIGYDFDPQDYWDYNLDRVQGEMTLYARWVKKAKVTYIDASDPDLKVVWEQGITAESPIRELKNSTMQAATPEGKTFTGYYADAECTIPYDFSSYQHIELLITDELLYEELCEKFPQYIEKIEPLVVEDTKGEEEETVDVESADIYLFMKKLGYQFTELALTDEAAMAEIRTYKNEIIDASIDGYLANTADKVVYLRFLPGDYIVVRSVEDLKDGKGNITFSAIDKSGKQRGGYYFESDIDLSGVNVKTGGEFTGEIYGNGHTIYNLTFKGISQKKDKGKLKNFGLCSIMTDVRIIDLHFVNVSFSVDSDLDSPVNAGFLAGTGENVSIEGCSFSSIKVDSGKNDTGNKTYNIGDLFGVANNCTLDAACKWDKSTLTVKKANVTQLLK